MRYTELLHPVGGRPAELILSPGSGQYIVPLECKLVLVSLYGAAGGGAGARNAISEGSGSGGGAGGYVFNLALNLKPGSVMDYVVGSGGTGGAGSSTGDGENGTNGENSSFGPITCSGGEGGKAYVYPSDDPAQGGSAGSVSFDYTGYTSDEILELHKYAWVTKDQFYYHMPRVLTERRGGNGGKTYLTNYYPEPGGDVGFIDNEHNIKIHAKGGTVNVDYDIGGGGAASFIRAGVAGSLETGIDGSLGSGGSGAGTSLTTAWAGGNGGNGAMIIRELFDNDPFMLFNLQNWNFGI